MLCVRTGMGIRLARRKNFMNALQIVATDTHGYLKLFLNTKTNKICAVTKYNIVPEWYAFICDIRCICCFDIERAEYAVSYSVLYTRSNTIHTIRYILSEELYLNYCTHQLALEKLHKVLLHNKRYTTKNLSMPEVPTSYEHPKPFLNFYQVIYMLAKIQILEEG